MTLQQVADYLNCNYTTAFGLVRRGKLPGFRLIGAWRFLRSDIEKWVAERQVRPYTPEKSGGRPGGKRGPKPKG